jgi:GNAT superfamily N-acetyltransferase
VAPALRFRLAVPADAPTIARTMALGFDTYRAFGPIGWQPPQDMTALVAMRLATPGAWALLAEVAGEPAGHVGLLPDHGDEARTAYLWQLFVRPPWWGTGLAGALHDAFVAEARARGYRQGALNTPAPHARARRFYERRGWRPDGPPGELWRFGIPVLGYRCRLDT